MTDFPQLPRMRSEQPQKPSPPASSLKFRHTEERFRLFAAAVQDYAIFMLDPDGIVSSWNAGAQRLKGYLATEIVGKHFSCFYPQEDLDNGKPAMELEVAAREGRFEDEGWRLRQDGSSFWANVVITAVRNEHGELIGFGKVTRDLTEQMRNNQALKQEISDRKQIEQRLLNSERSLRQLSAHLLRTQEAERRRIGRDLHDSLGQTLAAIKIHLDSLGKSVQKPGVSATDHLGDCLDLVQSAIKEVRTISYLLYPPMLEEMGLKAAVLWYLDGFSSRSGIATTFDIQSDFGRLNHEAELALFRVLQESLTNIHRHSGSHTASVRLFVNQEMAVLEIKDNGKGMPPSVPEDSTLDWINSPGVGLRGMTERMRQLSGRLEVVSTQLGTTVKAMVPAREAAK